MKKIIVLTMVLSLCLAGCAGNGADIDSSSGGTSSIVSTSSNGTQLTFEQAISSEAIDKISVIKGYAARHENYETADGEKIDQIQQWLGKLNLSETNDQLNVYGSTVYNISLEVDGEPVIKLCVCDLGTWYLRDLSEGKDYVINNYADVKDSFLQWMSEMSPAE